MGIESDDATGWVATDWFEDLVMRYGGADDYNDWVTHEMPFDSDLVREAAAEFEELIFTEGNVLGGREAITSTDFGTAGNPMFDAEPGCWLLQAGLASSPASSPRSIEADLDDEVGVFGFPPAEAGGENPVLGGGDLAMLLDDDEAAKDGHEAAGRDRTSATRRRRQQLVHLPAQGPSTPALYPNEIDQELAEVAYDSTAFLFDGSDQMPGEVGAGSFWKEMTAWINGPAGPRHHAEEHRRQLAGQLTT